MRKNILITGMPKSGKSTILKKLVRDYDKKVGFITNEVCEDKKRIGFEIETYAGQKTMLADINFKTDFKVSRYFVNVANLDRIIPRVSKFHDDDLLFLDEIGQMELFSKRFKQLVLNYLNSPNICISTLSKVYNDAFINQIKDRDDIILIEINEKNRDVKEKYLKILLKKILKAKKYISRPDIFKISQNKVSMVTDHGTRKLTKQKEKWICNCDFFQKNNICSHVIALEEYLRTNKLSI